MADTQGWNPRPLLAALIDAGFVNETRTVQRVVIDIQGGQSPLVYVQYEGDPDKITGVVDQVARSVPIVETSSAVVSFPYDRFETNVPASWPLIPTHREDPLQYARAVDQQPAGEPDTEQGREAAKGASW